LQFTTSNGPIDNYVESLRSPVRDQQEFAMKNLTVSFFKDETAATAIEYGLIAAGISVAIIAVVQGLGTNLKNTFSSVSTALK
jgi:pilus assembly protein Flp/PilA